MAADEVNAAGGVNRHLIQVNIYDDEDKPAQARDLAQQIATKTSALAVLGQVASSAAVAAGEVYKEQGLPAITGAASESRVTSDNEWFFRLIPDATGQGRFLADYARYRFGAHQIIVVRENGTAGDEFATAFRDHAKSEGIRVNADVEFLPADARDPATLAAIAGKLAHVPKGTIVVLGTQYAETPAVLRALRDKLGPFQSMGYSSMATEGISAQFVTEENERHAPGYYTDGLTVAAPQLGDIAEYAQTVFAARFRDRYGAEPNPEAVRWYEGARLIFQAMKGDGITGSEPKADRRRIRDWLAGLNGPAVAVAGTGGPIYFDKDRNVQRGISVGLFYEGRLISAPVQFLPVSDPLQVPGYDRLLADGMVIDADGVKIVKTPVVYAGFDLNSLDNIDVRAGTFSADFFLWLRTLDGETLDPHEVEFPTAHSGAQLGQEVMRRSRGGFTTVTYHVKGVFHAEYEFTRFPFDRQVLRIPMQVRNKNSYSMILAYGHIRPVGGGALGTSTPSHRSPVASRLWRMRDQIFYRDVVALQSSFGEQEAGSGRLGVEINRINAQVTVERDVLGFGVKNFLPLLCILVAVLVGYAIAADVINPRVSIGVTALLTTSVLYQKMASDLPSVTYVIGIDYVFFAFFAFCVAYLGVTVMSYETHKAKLVKPTKHLNLGGVLFTTVGLLLTLVFVWVTYWGRA